MCKEMPVIPVNRVVDKRIIIGKEWRTGGEEEERSKDVAVEDRRLRRASQKIAASRGRVVQNALAT
jgi:hypothetical protein